MPTTFSCFLIGDDSLLIECCHVLERAGQKVSGVITSETRVKDWASANDVRCIDEGDYSSVLLAESFDYLFSVTYLKIIPDEVLGIPAKGVINFHDGPLPAYAGLNTPAWALINQEQEYGVSWHSVTSQIDGGDLLAQKIFDVDSRETSLSINTKCFESAILTFEEIVDAIGNGTLEGKKQNLANRSYFGRYDRPPAACVVDWNQSAASIDALVRALDFGTYPNPLGFAKVKISEEWFAMRRTEIDNSAEGEPGEILSCTPEGLLIGTGEGSIRVLEFSSLDGANLTTYPDCMQVGACFNRFSPKDLSGFTDAYRQILKSEDFWRRRLESEQLVEAPLSSVIQSSPVAKCRYQLEVPDKVDDDMLISAFSILVARLSRVKEFALGFHAAGPDALNGLTAEQVPFQVLFDPDLSFEAYIKLIQAELTKMQSGNTYLQDLCARMPSLKNREGHSGYPVSIARKASQAAEYRGTVLCLAGGNGSGFELVYDSRYLSEQNVGRLSTYLQTLVSSGEANPRKAIGYLGLLPSREFDRLVNEYNQTDYDFDRTQCVHQIFEAQAEKTPYATAIVFQSEMINFLNLNSRANQLANYLIQEGVTPDTLVGVYVERSLEMLVCVLAVMKAGGAFVPLDPTFPKDRLSYIFSNSCASILLTQESLAASAPVSEGTSVIRVDADWHQVSECSLENPATAVTAANLAYVIYTSGSTGKPKGVMIEHRNVANFFQGMDCCIENDGTGSWLAVTSLSFDISILELLWTLGRGVRLILFRDEDRRDDSVPQSIRSKKMDFSLFMWGSDGSQGNEKYRLMLDASKFADENGFSAVWIPERHFNNWGGLYANPCVTAAAIATITSNIQIRAGSCVVPLHHPIRIAEDWSIVDNLSNGRVGIAAASGWQPADFVIRREGFENNKSLMFESIDQVQRLWRGESVIFDGVGGKPQEVQTQPRPIQDELPVWITSAGSVETFVKAGESGANLLTHLLGQSVDQVAEKIAAYREALSGAGYDPDTRTVTVMLHTLVGTDTAEVRKAVMEPLKDYLRGSISLLSDNVWAFPTFKRPGDTGSSLMDIDVGKLDEEDVDAIVDFSFERYFNQSGLFGTPERCMAMVNRLKAIGVNEIGCLIDYGVPHDIVQNSLTQLSELITQANSETGTAGNDFGFAAQVEQYDVTHLQCTPAMARMFSLNEETRSALIGIDHLLVGGEAFPYDLAREISEAHDGTLMNMYGPTETTIWSSTKVIEPGMKSVSIGKPIANTQMYILDSQFQPLPEGIAGDLYIGGEGVARGYQGREDLTQERFLDNPFREGERIYKTGDIASYLPDGDIEYLGRSDYQVKIRGFRIELEEIEAQILEMEAVEECVVVVDEHSVADKRLVAYIVAPTSPTDEAVRLHLKENLPEYMVPSHFIFLSALPQTPNGKIDRSALPSVESSRAAKKTVQQPGSELESQILSIWQKELGIKDISTDEPFFDVGGNSLLLVAVHRQIKQIVDKNISLTDLYRFPTVRALAEYLVDEEAGGIAKEEVKRRADARRARPHRGRRRKKS